ncbi:MAG: T9SS type A sorting domain-containing protein [Sphingobacteriaceae bacterium]|jgi:Secretion system C-terminal sorting domain|nr:T9SS type A sorting domain-containing protein [Sphingobacteriaceae bacterium]
MKKLYFVIFPFIALSIICTAFVSMKFHSKSSGGIDSRNGSPGEGTCSVCHSTGSNATTVSINVTPSLTSNEFTQGQTYTITITVAGSGYSKFGFGCEILEKPSNTNAGLMQSPGSGVQLINGSNGRKNALQTAPKNGSGTADFTFEWIAPSNSNSVTIYAVGNCVNGNGSTSGDFARAVSLTLTTPTVTALGEQKEASLKGFNLYPNPAQDKIHLSYSLIDPKNVKIQLSSISGEVVAELMNEGQTNGIHAKNLDIPAHLAAGVYFLKVFTDDQSVAQRLVVIK